jgi:hypothetical protein
LLLRLDCYLFLFVLHFFGFDGSFLILRQ